MRVMVQFTPRQMVQYRTFRGSSGGLYFEPYKGSY